MEPRRPGRKLLIASLGVAAVSYVACQGETSGNLVAPPGTDASTDGSAETNDAADKDQFVTSGNLVAPVVDAGSDADADAASSVK